MEAKLLGLRAALNRNRLQQKHVAEALGITRMTVWSWVDGRYVPNGINLFRLVEYLRQYEPGITAEDLMGPATPTSEARSVS